MCLYFYLQKLIKKIFWILHYCWASFSFSHSLQHLPVCLEFLSFTVQGFPAMKHSVQGATAPWSLTQNS